jgi:hypothetical protein
MRRLFLTLALLTTFIAGCSNNPAPQQGQAEGKGSEPAKATEEPQAQALTGREAFQKLYIAARNWSPDSQPIKMESNPRKGDKRDGTASIWTATFASPQRGMTRSFMWSGAVGEDVPQQGINPGSQDTYNAQNASTRPFDPALIRADTDKALSVADKHAPAKAKKAKDAPIKYQLYNDTSKDRLLWRVIYGGSESRSPGIVDISAGGGGFVKVEK